jgi:hypothetical protein
LPHGNWLYVYHIGPKNASVYSWSEVRFFFRKEIGDRSWKAEAEVEVHGRAASAMTGESIRDLLAGVAPLRSGGGGGCGPARNFGQREDPERISGESLGVRGRDTTTGGTENADGIGRRRSWSLSATFREGIVPS